MTELGPTSLENLWRETPRIDQVRLQGIITRYGFDPKSMSDVSYYDGMNAILEKILCNATAVDGQGVYIAGPVLLSIQGTNGEGIYTGYNKPPLPDCVIYRDGERICAMSPTKAFQDVISRIFSMNSSTMNIGGYDATVAELPHLGLHLTNSWTASILHETIRDASQNEHKVRCLNDSGMVITEHSDLSDIPATLAPNQWWERGELNRDIGTISLGRPEGNEPGVFLVERSK